MRDSPKLIIGEQSGTLPSVTSRARIAAARKLGIQHLRLNWNSTLAAVDDVATCAVTGVTWSQGRSILVEKALESGAWDYILLIDDDIFLLADSNLIAGQLRRIRRLRENAHASPIHRLLTLIERTVVKLLGRLPFKVQKSLQKSAIEALLGELRLGDPWSGLIFSVTDWGLVGCHNHLAELEQDLPIAGGDLQTRIYSRRLAEIVFPAPIPGSEGSMWFADYLVNTYATHKQLLFRSANAINLQHQPHSDGYLSHFRSRDLLLREYARLLPGSWPAWCGLGQQVGVPIREANIKIIMEGSPSLATGEVSLDALNQAFQRPDPTP